MYNDVKTFIEACDQVPSDKNIALYKNLMQEEWNEFWDAEFLDDDIEELDACMDLIWVVLGYCHMRGWDVNGAWNEVARSNLSKIDSNTGKVLKNESGKVMKPDNWSAPNLKDFV